MALKVHFSIQDTSGGGRQFVLALLGELDALTAATLEERLARLPEDERACLDLRELDFIDSTGLRAIVNAKRLRGDTLRIVGTRPAVAHVFEAAGAARLLTEQPSE